MHLFLLLALGCASLPLRAQDSSDPTEFVLSGFRLETQPGGHYYSNFIENLAPDAVWLTEESNGFGLLDRPKVYFEGDSWTQFHWDYAGYPLDSSLDDGAPGVQLPFLAIGSMSLRSETPERHGHGFRFTPRSPGGTSARIMVSTAFPNLGGYTFLGKLALGNHASLRADNLYATRRRLDGNAQLDFGFEKSSRASSLLLAAGYVSQERRFNDFNRRDTQFEEGSELLQVLGRWQRRYGRGELGLDLVANAGRRDSLFAENGRYPQETYEQERGSWLAGASWSGRPFAVRVSWLHERQELRPAVLDAGKDLVDIDGQGFFPFEKWGRFRSDSLAVLAERKISFSLLGREAVVEPCLDLRAVLHSASEQGGSWNTVSVAGRPYLVYLWQKGSAYRNRRQSATAGSLFRVDLSGRLAFSARLFLQYQGIGFQEAGNNVRFLQPGGEAGLTLRVGKQARISLSYGNLPYEMGGGVADFLEVRRPGASVYRWSDDNQDGLFQPGETGDLFGRSGGSAHFAARDLAPSRRERLLLFASTRISRHFSLNVKGLLKRIQRQLWVRFAAPCGHVEEIDGREYFLLDAPFSAFELGNAGFAKDPFYSQFLVQLQGEKARRWYFSFSFLAHMGMGTTSFGNGPEANDVGVISESQAFPNSWINGFGRVDGDRAFVGKIFFGYYLARRLFLGGSVKYRDGNPFAFIDAFQRDGQWLITYQTIKAEDEKGKKGGPREDCIWDFNFKLGYDMALFGKKGRLELSVFNLLDFGSELSENAFSSDAERLANELQLPRSLRLGLVLEL